MHLNSCLHPKVVINPYTKERIAVPCGKCAACLESKSLRWVSRLEVERAACLSTFFITLTYDNEHLPIADVATLDLIRPFDTRTWKDKDYDYVSDMNGNIPCLSVEDAQKFLKRLRYYANRVLSKEEAQIRYYLIGEMGARFFRPHYHAILFVKSQRLSEILPSLVCKAWKFGRVDTQFVKSSAAGYCAKYLNLTSRLPAVYSHPSLKPFSLKSIAPPIGSSAVSPTEVSHIFHTSSPTMRIFEPKSDSLVDVPLWRYLQNRLFPRLLLYAELTDCQRLSIYEALFDEVKKHSSLRYFRAWAQKVVNSYQLDKNCLAGNLFHYYLFCTCNKSCSYELLEEPKMSNFTYLYYLGKNLHKLVSQFNCSLRYVVQRIIEYYSNKDAYMLGQFYDFQSKYVLDGGDVRELIFNDIVFVNKVKKLKFEQMTTSDFMKLFSYGFTYDEVYWESSLDFRPDIFSRWLVEKTSDYINLKTLTEKCIEHNIKIKSANDYIQHKKNFNYKLYKPQLKWHNH